MNGIKYTQYEQIIAGALLKLNQLDSVDFNLLISDFEEKTGIRVSDSWGKFSFINKYVNISRDGIISLNRNANTSKDYELKDVFLRIAQDPIIKYFEEFDIEAFREKKQMLLLKNKNNVLNNANILLISVNEEDYNELIRYGFKNIDYFKSIIRADRYFREHPEYLEKYHIIFTGRRSIREDIGFSLELEQSILNIRVRKHVLAISLVKIGAYFEEVLYDIKHWRNFRIKEKTHFDLFDKIIENMLINNTLNVVDFSKTFPKYIDYINPNRLPLPSKVTDLKILCFGNECLENLMHNFGLNIEFYPEGPSSLENYVNNHLGDYDIIIAGNIYSNALLNMNNESTDQCKDTGRELTLLVTYDSSFSDVCKILGSRMNIKYVFGGNMAPDLNYHEKQFRILNQHIEENAPNDNMSTYIEKEYSQLKAIIEASINFYNDALIQIGKPGLSDLNFKTVEEMEHEYIEGSKHQIKEDNESIDYIIKFDEIRDIIIEYLDYKKRNLIGHLPIDLNIINDGSSIRVENICRGQILCTITFPKDYPMYYDLRTFDIQVTSKRGTLLPPQTIGIYTSDYEIISDIPNRPDKKQKNALLSIYKKINYALKPLNDEARCNYYESKKQKQLFRRSKGNKKLND